MKKNNLVLWMILAAIPLVNIIVFLAMWFVIYDNLKVLKPDTNRSIGKDILLCIVTCGIWGLFLPYLIMKDMQEGAHRVGVEAPNYILPYYLILVGQYAIGFALGLWGASTGNQGLAQGLSFLVGIVGGPIMAYLWLKPFNVVAEEFEKLG